MNTSRTDKKQIFGWVMYDFANSAYTTLVVTFIYATYFVSAIAPDKIYGTALWSRGVTVTALVVAFLSPLLGALADQGHLRKAFLFISTAVCVAGTAMLNFVMPGQVYQALVLFILSNVAFELGMVFYNAFLPDVSTPETIGRISGIGWGVGYIGGLAAMFIAMAGFISPEVPWFGLAKETGAHVRATNLLVAAWIGVFCIPLFLLVKSGPAKHARGGRPGTAGLVTAGILDIKTTFKEIRAYKEIVKLLVARMIYNDGLVTIFAFGGIYAAGTFGFTFQEIMIFGIVLNVAAGIGALVMGIFDDRLGGKKTIQISNIVLALAALLAVVAPDKTLFWVSGILVGFFAGPNQSASRSLLGRFVPREKENQFFGFFAFSGKLTAFFGPMLLGILTQAFDSQRAGISVVVLFFVIGGLILSRVDEEKGVAAAGKPEG
ncbi:MAG: MFS transporter [Desulfobacterales bacterium]|nr:MFS transporter [Desulfobacterales bacterium]